MGKTQSVLEMIKTMPQEDFDNWDGSDEKGLVGPEIVGTTEIAQMFNITKQAVGNWKLRHKDFPKPYTTLASGPIYLKSLVVAWGKKTGKL